MARLVALILAQVVLSSLAATEEEEESQREAMSSALAAGEEDEDVVVEKVEIIPSDKVLQGYSIVVAAAEANKMEMKMLVARAEVAMIEAERAREQKEAAWKRLAIKDEIHEEKLRALAQAIVDADKELEEAEAAAELRKSEAQAKLAESDDKVDAARNEMENRKRIRRDTESEVGQMIKEQEAKLAGAMQRILSSKRNIAEKQAGFDAAKDALELAIAKQKQQESHTEAAVAAAMDELEAVENDADAAVAAARLAKEKAEQALSKAKTRTGGAAEASGHCDQMLADAKQAQKQAADDYAKAMTVQSKTREWQKMVDAFYVRLTNVEFNGLNGRRLWGKLKESASVSASDDASGRPVSRRIKQVPVEETVAGAKHAFAMEAAVIDLASALTTNIPGIATQIEQAVEEIQAKTAEMMNPLCKWYVLAVMSKDSADADACAAFKAHVESNA